MELFTSAAFSFEVTDTATAGGNGLGPLYDAYDAYDAIFSGFSDDERAWLFRRTAERWYAPAAAADA